MEKVSRHLEQSSHQEHFQLTGRVLYLTQDPALIRTQLDGETIALSSETPLLDNISTDEIIPNAVCLTYTGHPDESLGDGLLSGLRGGVIKAGEIAAGNFQVIVAGNSYGRGSSRMHAQVAHLDAGISLISANVERIFGENCVNYGIYTTPTNSEQLQTLLRTKSIESALLIEQFGPISQRVMQLGGIIPYLEAVTSGKEQVPAYETGTRPMTIAEKIIARHAQKPNGEIGVPAVVPGQEYIAQPDFYYGYELQTTITRNALNRQALTSSATQFPDKAVLFDDHTALLAPDFKPAQIQRAEQKIFAQQNNITLYEKTATTSVAAICHTEMLDHYILPGQLILGNDSHTCTGGAANAVALGKGAADLAGALAFDRMLVTVPESIKINLTGHLQPGVTTKDVVLAIFARTEFKEGLIGSKRVFEFCGDGLETLSVDQQMKLTNMAVEGQAATGIIAPNRQLRAFLHQKRPSLSAEAIDALFVISDDDAEYAFEIPIDLSTIEPTVATPGDTQNGRPLSEILSTQQKIDIAYIGSCTHGTVEDLQQAAAVLRGKTIAKGVTLYVQASSMDNLVAAAEAGYIADLVDAGAELLLPGCGACMNAGPGSVAENQVGLFATNRNYPGRTGKGDTFLASVPVVAASAIKGEIYSPTALVADENDLAKVDTVQPSAEQ